MSMLYHLNWKNSNKGKNKRWGYILLVVKEYKKEKE